MKAILLLAGQHLAKTWPRPVPLGNSILAWSMIHGYYGLKPLTRYTGVKTTVKTDYESEFLP